MFFKSGMIEAWGRGFEKITEACRKYDGPLPEYDINADGIMVLCKACDKYLELLNGDIPKDGNYKINFAQNERSLSEVLSGVLSQKDIDKVKPILNILEEKGFISPKEAERSCGKSAATVRRYLNLLVQTGIVVLEGNTNNAVYKIIEK